MNKTKLQEEKITLDEALKIAKNIHNNSFENYEAYYHNLKDKYIKLGLAKIERIDYWGHGGDWSEYEWVNIYEIITNEENNKLDELQDKLNADKFKYNEIYDKLLEVNNKLNKINNLEKGITESSIKIDRLKDDIADIEDEISKLQEKITNKRERIKKLEIKHIEELNKFNKKSNK